MTAQQVQAILDQCQAADEVMDSSDHTKKEKTEFHLKKAYVFSQLLIADRLSQIALFMKENQQ